MVDGISIREAARVFGLHRETVRKMLKFSIPPGYRRAREPVRPKLDPFKGLIERILEEDASRPKKQRHTAKRIFERLRDEHSFSGGYTIVKDYVRESRLRSRAMFVHELDAWRRDDAFWPEDRSFEAFKKFFDVRFCSIVLDMGEDEIEKDSTSE